MRVRWELLEDFNESRSYEPPLTTSSDEYSESAKS